MSSCTPGKKSIVSTRSCGSRDMSFSCATGMESLFTIAVIQQGPMNSSSGAFGWAVSGPSKSKEQTALGPVSPNNDRFSSTAASITALGIPNSLVRVQPIFDPVGKLAGVLDVSAVILDGTERTQQLALAATIASARAVEERLFREFFPHAWIIAASRCDDSRPALLLALDDDQRIVGADHVARRAFCASHSNLTNGVPLAAIFDYSLSIFRRGSGQDIPSVLTQTDGLGSWKTLITRPLSRSRGSHTSPESIVHGQPRIPKLDDLSRTDVPPLSRGGLSPALTHRICKYIESHLAERISLEALASMAGLSTHHFARAFRQSLGAPPHGYLLQRRLDMLSNCSMRLDCRYPKLPSPQDFPTKVILLGTSVDQLACPQVLARRLER